MSFESDKSDSFFTQGVWCRCFNRAIGLFPAEKTEGTGGAMSLSWFFLQTLCEPQCKNLCPVVKGIERDSAPMSCKKARVDT